MQCNFNFYFFASSRLALPQVVMKKLFDYFWKSISPFSNFCVNSLLSLHFLFWKNCVLNGVNGFCNRTCLLVAVRVREMCFMPAKSRKKLNFLRFIHVFDLVLKYCSDINEGNWLQFVFYPIIMMDIPQILEWGFLICNSGFRLKFSRIAVSRKRLQLESKTDLTTTGLFLGFQVESAECRRFHFCMDWNLHELLKFYSILTNSKIFDSLRCILFCCFNKIVLFRRRIL